MTYRSSVRPVRVTKKPKKKDKEPKQYGKLSIRPDHPRHRIEMRSGMMGGLWVVVLSFKFDQSLLSGYRDFRGQNWSYCITLANGL